jgi:predicted nucleotidyltransferase
MQWHPNAADLPALLAKLCDAGVEFIIVGGAAAVLQGAPVTTFDLDIVHRRTPENVARLLEVLQELDATMRYDFARRGLRPTAEMLAGRGQINLSTSLGPIDPLCELDEGQGYDELLPHIQSVMAEGRLLRVLDLPTLIAVKTKAGRPKDRMALPILVATLQERDKAKP